MATVVLRDLGDEHLASSSGRASNSLVSGDSSTTANCPTADPKRSCGVSVNCVVVPYCCSRRVPLETYETANLLANVRMASMAV